VFVPVSPYCANEGRDVVVWLAQGGWVVPGCTEGVKCGDNFLCRVI